MTDTKHQTGRRFRACAIMMGLPLLFIAALSGACTPPPDPTPLPNPQPTEVSAASPNTAAVSATAATASPAPILVPTPTAHPPAVQLTLPLPQGWTMRAATTLPGGGPGMLAVRPQGARLQAQLTPGRGLLPARYVEAVSEQLRVDGLDVTRAGIVYDIRQDGIPVGLIEYGNAAGNEAIQWIMPVDRGEAFLIVTLATVPDMTDTARAEIGAVLADLKLDALDPDTVDPDTGLE